MTTFEYGTTQLESLGNVTLINDYLDIPSRRGNNKTIPFRHGTVWNQKFYDERTLAFGIAVLGTSLADLETKMDTIRGLFSEQTPQTLTIVYGDSTTKTALVTVDKPLQVQRTKSLARIVVEFTMCQPFFRLSTEITDNTQVVDETPEAMTVTNPGTIEERDATIVIHGAFTAVTITNTTTNTVLTYTGTIATDEEVVIGTSDGEYYAERTGSVNVIGNVTHSGSSALMTFDVGDNTLAITSAGYDGNSFVRVKFFAPFL